MIKIRWIAYFVDRHIYACVLLTVIPALSFIGGTPLINELSVPAITDLTCLFKRKRSDFEIARFLMIFGGIPKYLEQIDPNDSLSVNMYRLCFQKGGFFLNEFETIFKEQFKVIKTYTNISRLLAQSSLTKELISKNHRTNIG